MIMDNFTKILNLDLGLLASRKRLFIRWEENAPHHQLGMHLRATNW